ncbi:solute carrier family 2, facilitated glucose transporter member 1-like isoform X2 [Thrips palmi]|uniref:Solute carrier family 2, facilitated glucose transporter member 1-like isoform X2 n=1 Tax=Thrips palmi TaxID=161013 RepID=A0A6P8YZX5_THRPL|nr:solute carrier family 2, facilitated glucose transporter member 1-like isoform X2 [Thrips palmi]
MTVTKLHILDTVERDPHKVAGWTPLLVVAAAVTALGSALPVGYNIGVINTPAAIIKVFCNESVAAHYGGDLGDTQLEVLWSIIVSVFLVGGMTGSMSGGWAADRIGRRGAIGATIVLNLVAASMFVACKATNSVELLLLARLVVGFSSGLSTSVVPMYLTELAPIHLRGALGVVCPLGINIGVLAGQFAGLDWMLGTADSWHQLLALFGPMSLVGGLLVPVLPESPKYLFLVRGEEERGVRELARIRRQPEERLSEELRAMRMASKDDAQAEAKEPQQGEWTAARVLRAPELVLPLLLVCALQAGQQLSGINAVFYYSNSVFRTAGLNDVQTQYATLGCGCVNLATSLLALPLVNGCGRRVLMLLSTLSACLCLVLLGTSIMTINSISWMPYVAIASVLLYVLVYGLGMGPIPYFIGSELFDVGPRPIGMALGSLSNWGGNFIVGMSFPTIQSVIGPASFYVFATITAAQAILLKFYLPETKGRDTAEVADMLRLGFKSKVAKSVKPTTNIQHNSA